MMFHQWSEGALQYYWWGLVALLAGLFVFMSFVQGGQSLLFSLGREEERKDLLVNSLGRKWELGFTTLVMFGGALFAAFPLFYATSFGGAYYLWMAILFCFILQAVAYEYRRKPGNLYGSKVYELFMLINGTLGIFLIGVALATLYTGGNFVVDARHLSRWTRPSYGLEALGNLFNIAFRLMLFFLARLQGALYFINNVEDEEIRRRARRTVRYEGAFFVLLYLYVLYRIATMLGYAYDHASGVVSSEAFKYLHNLQALPPLSGLLIAGTLLVLLGWIRGGWSRSRRGIWWSGIGSVLAVTALILTTAYNHTAYYPSVVDPQSSLTLANSSGSRYTLMTMGYVSLLVPFVLAYIAAVWRVMNRTPLTPEEVRDDPHRY